MKSELGPTLSTFSGAGPGKFWAIRAVARAGQPGEILLFCHVSNARFYRFFVSQISWNLNTSRQLMSRQNLKNFKFCQRLATSGRNNSAMIIVWRKFVTKWSLYGKSSFHFLPLESIQSHSPCLYAAYKKPAPNFLGRRATVDGTTWYMNLILVTHSQSGIDELTID